MALFLKTQPRKVALEIDNGAGHVLGYRIVVHAGYVGEHKRRCAHFIKAHLIYSRYGDMHPLHIFHKVPMGADFIDERYVPQKNGLGAFESGLDSNFIRKCQFSVVMERSQEGLSHLI